jgi:hypothetical protein
VTTETCKYHDSEHDIALSLIRSDLPSYIYTLGYGSRPAQHTLDIGNTERSSKRTAVSIFALSFWIEDQSWFRQERVQVCAIQHIKPRRE